MTRIAICRANFLMELEREVNSQMARLEAEGLGVKSVEVMSHGPIYALVIVYGNGPTTTQRWSGSHG